MLFAKSLSLIDSAEERAQWLSRAGKQWGVGHALALRVRSTDGPVLGSTIPAEVVWNEQRECYCSNWLTVTQPTTAELHAAAAEPQAAAAEPQAAATSEATPPVLEIQADAAMEEEETAAPSEEPQQQQEEERIEEETVAVEVISALAAEEAPAEAEMRASVTSQTNRDPIKVDCIGISVSSADSTADLVVLEIITLEGKVVSTVIANISAIHSQSSPQHYSLFVTPSAAATVDDTTIHGVLDFTVMTNDYWKDNVQGSDDFTFLDALRFDPSMHMPTPLRTASSVSVSSDHMYFPSSFLTGTGAYFVSNILCVESNSPKNDISVELVVTGDSHLIRLTPPQAVVKPRERAYFICTWNSFKCFTPTAEDSKVKIHLLVREGEDNKPPVDIHLHGEPPRPSDTNPPFLLWVNMTMTGNTPCSVAERERLLRELPVYSLSNKPNNNVS